VNHLGITKEQIILTSLKILNRDGIDRLTTRELAKELNIKSASLYWHFKGKQDLYGAIAEYMCLHSDMPEDMDNPQDYLERTMQAYRLLLLKVKDSPAIFENSIPNTPARIAIIKVISKKLSEMGVKNENLMTISNMLNNYVLSFTADEMRYKDTPPETLRLFNDILDPGITLTILSPRDFDEQFLYGLRVLFIGVKESK